MPSRKEIQKNSITKTVNVYRLIEAFLSKTGRPPVVRELMGMGAASSSYVVDWHIRRLKSWGLLESEPKLSRTIRLNPIESAKPEIQSYFRK